MKRKKKEKPEATFDKSMLDKSVIAIPLLERMEEDPDAVQPVIIDLNLEYVSGRKQAREQVKEDIEALLENPEFAAAPGTQGINETKSESTPQYWFARLGGALIRELVKLDVKRASDAAREANGKPPQSARAIYRIWPDFKVRALTCRSIITVKADAAARSFCALGSSIVWAVMDSGIDASHPHFAKNGNIDPKSTLHRDFTALGGAGDALVDKFGHGTHVAGIIAGQADCSNGKQPVAVSRQRDERGEVDYDQQELSAISGMAPECKLVSLKVLDDQGVGEASNLIAAIAQIQEINGYGRRILIHGVNMSVGYDFEPEWFACGQSPLCVEVDRLVKSGVVVVVAAGNTGYGWTNSEARGQVRSGLDLTINDPGNAELAITVGSTHRDMPHVYGVSYFSSKGPTGDGRLKPDLVAPGEKILSCATGDLLEQAQSKSGIKAFQYTEDSGTSMAAPHVSGVIAAFLSVRREFIGRPEEVKRVFLSTATDLKRDRYFQGAGLVDLMRAIQSV